MSECHSCSMSQHRKCFDVGRNSQKQLNNLQLYPPWLVLAVVVVVVRTSFFSLSFNDFKFLTVYSGSCVFVCVSTSLEWGIDYKSLRDTKISGFLCFFFSFFWMRSTTNICFFSLQLQLSLYTNSRNFDRDGSFAFFFVWFLRHFA